MDLKKMGFTFVGSTICYAFMQSVGTFNDHVVMCFRHKEQRGFDFVPAVEPPAYCPDSSTSS